MAANPAFSPKGTRSIVLISANARDFLTDCAMDKCHGLKTRPETSTRSQAVRYPALAPWPPGGLFPSSTAVSDFFRNPHDS